MRPRDLSAARFAGYPPEAQKLAIAHLETLRRLPMSFLDALLRQIIDYDYDFPAERRAISGELTTLSALSPVQLNEWFADFSKISTPS